MVRFWVICALISTTACQEGTPLAQKSDSLGDRAAIADATQRQSTAKVGTTKPEPPASIASSQEELEAAHCANVTDPQFDPDICLAEPEFRPVKFAGHWRITNVFVGDVGVTSYDRDDPVIVGAAFDISLKQLRWRDEKRDFHHDDVCEGPVIGAIDKIAEAELGGLALDALKAWDISDAARGAMYRMSCTTAGNWGPSGSRGEMVIVPIGNDKLAMQWYDDTVLLAQRYDWKK
ncbi:hypothetical protein ACFOWX_03530 [Sphingorhabdus arenilitoris]|uniref:Uncharacterized protein n=1 Tax=Sphingorhabdus arenilitoris TaxID=1490041 RepID=A0ABV8RE27_9SPHN